MGESRFQKMQRIWREERDAKVRGEAKQSQLTDEKARIFKQFSEEIGQPVTSLEQAENISLELKQSIETDIDKMAQILKEEGYEV